MKPQLYQINKFIAQDKKIPQIFVAIVLAETQRAVYLFGHGTLESRKIGACCICGRTLTHPVSVILGIGPECGGHYWDWKLIGGYSTEIEATLIAKIEAVKVDSWFPKSAIRRTWETETVIPPPAEHPVLNRINAVPKKTTEKILDHGFPSIKLHFGYDPKIIEAIKTIPGRKYNAKEKFWIIPETTENIQKIQALGFVVETSPEPIPPEEINELLEKKKHLYPFQKEGVMFLQNKQGRALLADEMGLGKTVQTLAWLNINPEKHPVLIVVPASLKLNWFEECKRWLDNFDVTILSGTKTHAITSRIIIVNYDVLAYWTEEIQKVKPQVLILDECHYIKNNSAKRTKVVKTLSKTIKHVIALSGTPIINRPIEFFNTIKIINPHLFDFWKFAHRYCGARNNGYGWEFSRATNTEELHKILQENIMLRRIKSEVLTELPEKTFSFVPMEMDNWKEYKYAENDFLNYLREKKGHTAAGKASQASILVQIETLKQLAATGKIKQTLNWIEDFLESGNKLVVFAVHRFMIDVLMNHFGSKAVKIDGSVSLGERNNAVQAFQNNPDVRLFIGNIKAAGVGLTLTAAHNVCFLELPWTPGELVQAEDRCHRIGQKNSVNIYYLLATKTIEEKMVRLLDSKRIVLNSVLDGKGVNETTLLHDLIKTYENENNEKQS